MNRSHLATAAAVLVVALLTAGCAEDQAADPPTTDDSSVGHIHGLGINPANDSLYVATHFGVFRVDENGNRTRVADRWQDTMAFTIVGPNHFLASGHPDLREDLPPHLGLIESTDAGETWTPLALQGEADFHILEPAGDSLYAYDATSGRLLHTEDRKNFDQILQGPLISVAASNGDDPLIATGGKGQLLRIDPAAGEMRELDGPTTIYLDAAPDGTLAGIDPDGIVRISLDRARSWEEVGSIEGAPTAFMISDQGWYAATETEVFNSTDGGRTWNQVL